MPGEENLNFSCAPMFLGRHLSYVINYVYLQMPTTVSEECQTTGCPSLFTCTSRGLIVPGS
jgi:hypothetical protein